MYVVSPVSSPANSATLFYLTKIDVLSINGNCGNAGDTGFTGLMESAPNLGILVHK